ncbi:MAG: CapA family protein [Marinifilaceae bacterium]
MKRIAVTLFLLLSLTAVNAQLVIKQPEPILVTDTMKLTAPEQFAPTLPDTVSILGVGDIMLGTNFPSPRYLPPGDGSSLMGPLLPILNNATISFGNLEGPYSDSLPITKNCRDTANCYAFRSPDYLFPNIVEAGFDVLSLSNNHSGDLGLAGRRNTIRLIEEAGLQHVGLLEYPTTIVEKRGIKFGFCAFSPNTGTCDINNLEEAERIVKQLDKQCDIIVVSFHGGAEGSKYQKMPKKREIFLGENRGNVYEFAHRMVDAGADVVFGHGPHVIRAMDLYKNRFIIYSLGNFCTYSRMKVSGVNGLAPIVKVFTNKNGVFLKGKIYPAYQIKGTGTRLDPYKRAISKIRELTRQDLPEVKVNISEEGVITQ